MLIICMLWRPSSNMEWSIARNSMMEFCCRGIWKIGHWILVFGWRRWKELWVSWYAGIWCRIGCDGRMTGTSAMMRERVRTDQRTRATIYWIWWCIRCGCGSIVRQVALTGSWSNLLLSTEKMQISPHMDRSTWEATLWRPCNETCNKPEHGCHGLRKSMMHTIIGWSGGMDFHPKGAHNNGQQDLRPVAALPVTGGPASQDGRRGEASLSTLTSRQYIQMAWMKPCRHTSEICIFMRGSCCTICYVDTSGLTRCLSLLPWGCDVMKW